MYYTNRTKEEIEKIVRESFSDYKDPTEGMTLEQKKLFHEAFKEVVQNYTNENYNNRFSQRRKLL